MPNVTPAQNAAIRARNPEILVSAAAGSGKTFVLVERVKALLREGAHIDRMLICTFTRAAASEMRERLSRVLEDDPELAAEARRLPAARISTLHVFCDRMIRRHFQAAGVDPMYMIVSGARREAMRREAAEAAMEALCASGEPDDAFLTDCFSDDELLDMLLRAHEFLVAQADPDAWLDRFLSAPPERVSDAPWQEELLRRALLLLQTARTHWDRCGALLISPDAPHWYASACESDGRVLDALIRAMESGERVEAPAFDRLATKRAPCDGEIKAAFQASRDALKKTVKEACALVSYNAETAQRELDAMMPAQRALLRALGDMRARFDAAKDARNLLDFSDLEHRAIKALSDEACRESVRGELDALFVDEYQDTSAVQEAVVRLLFDGRSPLFMVGDVKQSIYRFRQADPTLFLRKYNTFSADEHAPCRLITLSENFRSLPSVLDAVNRVFEGVMFADATEIDYDARARLRPGIESSAPGPAACFHVIGDWQDADTDADADAEPERADAREREAALMGKLIRDMVGTETVIDPRTRVPRPVQYRDIAILMRSVSGRAAQLAERLSAEGIPVYSEADARYYDQPEVADALALLRVMDNPLDDVNLLALLRGPVFGFDDAALADVRLAAPRGAEDERDMPYWRALDLYVSGQAPGALAFREALDRVEAWRALSLALPVGQLLWRLLSEAGLYAYSGALPGGLARQANLRLMCQRAGEADSLSDFLSHVEEVVRDDDGVSAKTLSEKENVVRILTIHKSKGLEFPVVILAELAAAFKSASADLLLLDSELGPALKFTDPDARVRGQTLKHRALSFKKKRESLAEEARLLYVGMTRARDRLHMIATPRALHKTVDAWCAPPSAGAAASARCMADWVGRAVLWEAHSSPITLQKWLPAQLPAAPEGSVPADAPWQPEPVDPRVAAMLSRPKPNTRYRPLKTSVTAMARDAVAEDDETPDSKRAPLDARTLPFLSALPELPDFSPTRALTGAERGTATHQALGLIDLNALRGKTGDALSRALNDRLDALFTLGALDERQRGALSQSDLRVFFESRLGQRLLAADTVRREASFNLLAPDGVSLLQGVLDACFLEDGQWVLIDYKTDRAPLDELTLRYQTQLALYADALTRVTRQPIREGWLYALSQNAGARFDSAELARLAARVWSAGAAQD